MARNTLVLTGGSYLCSAARCAGLRSRSYRRPKLIPSALFTKRSTPRKMRNEPVRAVAMTCEAAGRHSPRRSRAAKPGRTMPIERWKKGARRRPAAVNTPTIIHLYDCKRVQHSSSQAGIPRRTVRQAASRRCPS